MRGGYAITGNVILTLKFMPARKKMFGERQKAVSEELYINVNIKGKVELNWIHV